jgi:hypothetical protein
LRAAGAGPTILLKQTGGTHESRHRDEHAARARPGRLTVLRTLPSRAAAVEAEDTFYAFRAVFHASHPGIAFERGDYDAYRDQVLNLVRQHFPHGMAVKMLLKPLDMNPLVARATLPAVTHATRLFLRRYDKAA